MDHPPRYPEEPPVEGFGSAPSAPTAPPRPPAGRVARRPEPRVSTAIAAVGCALAVTGSFVVSGDALDGSGGDGGSQLPGLLLSGALLAAGLALLAKASTAAYRTAGSVATVLAIPAIAFFLTYDEGGLPPFSVEAVLGLSAGGWLLLHATGPAAGRAFPLGAGVFAAWLFVLQVVEEPFTEPFDIFGQLFLAPAFDESFGPDGFDAPDPTTMGALTLGIAGLVVWLGHRADQRGAHGRAVALAAPPIVMVPVGVLLLATELEETGTGLALVALGVALCASGARRGRRATTWAGALFVYNGAGVLLDQVAPDSATGIGVAAMLAGAGIVFLGDLLANALHEPDELEPGPAAATGAPPTTAF